ALLIAALGLYSVIAYDVVQRTHEMGVRIALGAQRADVVRLVVRDGLALVVGGVVLGGIATLVAARWVQPLLFDERSRNPAVLGSVAALLIVVAVVASWVPARRASSVDPQVALRTECPRSRGRRTIPRRSARADG